MPEKESTIEGIPLDHFIINTGYPLGGSEDYDAPKLREGAVEGYYRVNMKDLILFRSGLTIEDTPARGTATREEWNEINARLNPLKFLVREAEGTYSNIGLCPPTFYSYPCR